MDPIPIPSSLMTEDIRRVYTDDTDDHLFLEIMKSCGLPIPVTLVSDDGELCTVEVRHVTYIKQKIAPPIWRDRLKDKVVYGLTVEWISKGTQTEPEEGPSGYITSPEYTDPEFSPTPITPKPKPKPKTMKANKPDKAFEKALAEVEGVEKPMPAPKRKPGRPRKDLLTRPRSGVGKGKTIGLTNTVPLVNMTKSDLVALAKSRGIRATGKWNRNTIIDRIIAAGE